LTLHLILNSVDPRCARYEGWRGLAPLRHVEHSQQGLSTFRVKAHTFKHLGFVSPRGKLSPRNNEIEVFRCSFGLYKREEFWKTTCQEVLYLSLLEKNRKALTSGSDNETLA